MTDRLSARKKTLDSPEFLIDGETQVERNGVGESADAVWKPLNTEYQKLFPTTSQSNDCGSPDGQTDILHASVRPG